MMHKIKVVDRVVTTTVVKNIRQLNQSLNNLLSIIGNNNDTSNLRHIVGLDIEKCYYGVDKHHIAEKVAIVKLCFGTNCVIIQLLHMDRPPCALAEFFQLQEVSFVGIGIKHCLDALSRDYGIKCRNAVDLGQLAATVRKSDVHRSLGLLDLVKSVCSLDMKKSVFSKTSVEALGSWGAAELSTQQIEAATWGAFLCFYAGNHLCGGYLPKSEVGTSSSYGYYYD